MGIITVNNILNMTVTGIMRIVLRQIETFIVSLSSNRKRSLRSCKSC